MAFDPVVTVGREEALTEVVYNVSGEEIIFAGLEAIAGGEVERRAEAMFAERERTGTVGEEVMLVEAEEIGGELDHKEVR